MSELSTESPKFIIVDGHSLLYRSFFGTRFLSTTDGRPTNALFGFVNMLLNLIETERPKGFVVAFDAPAKTFRHDEFEDYKAHRKEAAPEFSAQVPIAKEMVKALGIKVLELSGFEADDVVGTVAIRAKDLGYHSLIVTGDMDALQLVQDNITVIATIRGVTDIHRYDRQAVIEKTGLTPEQVADYKALRGDPSDNIPGIPGVGEKTAVKLLLQFGSIENLLEHTDEISDLKLRDKVEKFCDNCRQSKYLATIIQDAPVEFIPEPYEPTEETVKKATEFLNELEFRTVIKRLPKILLQSEQTAESPAPPKNIKELKAEAHTSADHEQLSTALQNAENFAIIVNEDGIAVSADGINGYWLAFNNNFPDFLTRLFASNKVEKYAHDAKKSIKSLHNEGIFAVNFTFDSLLTAYILDPTRSTYSFEILMEDYLEASFAAKNHPEEYACLKAAALYKLKEPMLAKLKREGTHSVLEKIDLPVTPVVAKMELFGICVDPKSLTELSERLSKQIEQLESEIFAMTDGPFNIGSPKQLGDILFEKLGLTGGKKTKSGGFSTGADMLMSLIDKHPIAEKVLSWRELTKIKNTYADSLCNLIQKDGRIHTTFNMTVAATGRLSSQDPNLQNIPIKSETGREIRRAFVADKGYKLLSIDYSQIELRLLAHMSEMKVLVDSFDSGEDIHIATAAILFGIPLDQVTKEQRRIAKTTNYAVLYGISEFGLSQQLHIPVADCRKIIEDYFARFPEIRAFTLGVVEEARDKGFTTTLMGRKRYFPELRSSIRMERLAAERAAVNAPIQGSAADLIKIAMIQIGDRLESTNSRMLLQVHDELLFECPDSEGEKLAPDLAKIMTDCYPLIVPLEVEARIGPNWRDLKPITLN